MSRLAVIGVAALAVLVSAGVSALMLTSNHATNLVATTAIAVPIGIAFIGSGLIARVRRPDNRTGTLLMLVGFSWFLGGISAADNPYVFTFGVACNAVALGFLAHLILAFPTGRLSSRRQVALAAGGYALAVVANPVILLFADTKHSCAECPSNVLLVHRDQGLADALDIATAVLAVALIVGIGAVLVRRWRSASIAYRRAVAPVLISSGVMLGALVASLIYDAAHSGMGMSPVGWVLMVALLSVPLSFLYGLLRSRLAGAAVGRLLADTPETPTPEEAQEGLRRALGDPTLELGFWWPEHAVYVGASGEPIEPDAGDPRVVTYLTDAEDLPLAAIAHDAALLEERDLLEGALAAARLAIQKDRLAAEARARLMDLERERDFTRTVVDSAPAFFCVLDAAGRIQRFNKTLEGASGLLDDEDIRGRFFWDMFPAVDEREVVRAAIEARAGDQQEHRWIAGRRRRTGRDLAAHAAAGRSLPRLRRRHHRPESGRGEDAAARRAAERRRRRDAQPARNRRTRRTPFTRPDQRDAEDPDRLYHSRRRRSPLLGGDGPARGHSGGRGDRPVGAGRRVVRPARVAVGEEERRRVPV
jgi:PAS domain S-box-containing protein